MIYLIFVIGLIMGSFYLVVATRLPQKEDVVFSRSHCDNCKVNLKWYQLIPVLSFFLMGFKCPKCKKRIPIINLIIELVTGLLFAFMYLRYGFCYEFYAGVIISSLLVIIFITDFKYMIILDSPLIISSFLIFFLKFIYFGYKAAFLALFSGVVLFLTMLLIGKIGNVLFKKESLGGGDIKFAFVIGIILGVKLGLICIVLSSFIALPVSVAALITSKNNEVPYGPFLIGSLLIVFVFMVKFTNLLNFLLSL